MFSDWQPRLASVGATTLEQEMISASYYSSPTQVQAALDTLVSGITNAQLALMLANWRANAGPFLGGFPGGGMLFGAQGLTGPQGPPGPVASFNARTGAITLTKADVTGTGLAAADVGADASGAASTAVAALRLDNIGVPTATVNAGNQKLSNVANAAAATDALNRQTADGRYLQALSVRTVTGTDTASINDRVILLDPTGGAFTETLPDSTLFPGTFLILKAIGASTNSTTVSAIGGQTIDGAGSITVGIATSSATYASAILIAASTTWRLV